MVRSVLVVCVAVLAGCSKTSDCSCRPSGLFVPYGSDVRDLTVRGPACADATIRSHGIKEDAAAGQDQVDWFVPYANTYSIYPKRGGDCSIYVVMRDGSVGDKTVLMEYQEPGSACCSGAAYAVNGNGFLDPAEFTQQSVDASVE
jgi:hypothetical protein